MPNKLSKHSYVAKTKEDALNKCYEELNVNEEEIYVKETQIAGKLFKASKIELEVLTQKELVDFIKYYINQIGTLMWLDIKTEIRTSDQIINVTLICENNAILIGKDGRTLNAIQNLLRQSISVQSGFNVKINIDVCGYKEKRKKRFEREIKNICRSILRDHIEVKLDPMNSYQRRIVHNVVNKYEDLKTESIGEEPNRYVVISYKK